MAHEQTLTWSGKAVDAGRIEVELARLRYNAAGEPSGGEGFAIRTSLLNLVAYAANEEAAREASQTIAGLTGHHPSRALIVIASPSESESRIDAQLAAHCHIASGLEQQVCCEEVVLNVQGRAANHIHSIIIPLLVPDLPVYVWWTGPLPRGRHLFEEMLEAADRFIVDSARFRHPTHGLSRVAHLCAETPDCAIGDLNWTRLAPWRQLLAQHSDTPDVRQYMDSIERLEISYVAGPTQHLPSQVFLLLGWMAERFGWATRGLQVRDTSHLTLHQDGRWISVVFTSEQDAYLETGSLLAVRIHGNAEGADVSLSIGLTEEPLHVAIEVKTPDCQMEERVRIEAADPGEMLAAELDALPGQSTQYEHILERVLPLIDALDTAH